MLEKRQLTVIKTHEGLLRYKRLYHMGISCASEEFSEVNMTDDLLIRTS